MLNYYSESLQLEGYTQHTTRGSLQHASLALKLGGSAPITTRRGSYDSLISRVTRCKSTRMMAFANTEDPWIDYLIISRLGGCYATPIIQFFQDGRF
jgi:hypothetical protein